MANNANLHLCLALDMVELKPLPSARSCSHAKFLWRLAHHAAAFCRVEVDHVTGRASRVVARNRDGEESVYEADAVIFSVGVTGLCPHGNRSAVLCPAKRLYDHGLCINMA